MNSEIAKIFEREHFRGKKNKFKTKLVNMWV